MAKKKEMVSGNAPERIILDMNELSIDDLIDLEDEGVNLSKLTDISDIGGRALRALVWVVCRKDDPDLTLEQVGGWSFTALAGIELKADAVDPTDADS